MSWLGRQLKILKDGIPIAACQSKSVTRNNEMIDVSGEEDDGFKHFLEAIDTKEIVIQVDGIMQADHWHQLIVPKLNAELIDVDIEFPNGYVIYGHEGAYITALSLTGEYRGAARFSATIVLSGEFSGPEIDGEDLNITVLSAAPEDEAGTQNRLLEWGSPTGLIDEEFLGLPFSPASPSFFDIYPEWDGEEPLFPDGDWYPDVWIAHGVVFGGEQTWEIFFLLEGDAPDSWNIQVSGNVQLISTDNVGVGTYNGRAGAGIAATVQINSLISDTNYEGTVTATASVGAATYQAKAVIRYRSIFF
jgi:predicted secreted protein